MLSTLEPVVTVVLAGLIFGERLEMTAILGGGLILVAVILLTLGEWDLKKLKKDIPLVE
jgi:drug/metabolite transporter (DMT)-like permease